jgi:acetolactate synthase I/II/III large subunit
VHVYEGIAHQLHARGVRKTFGLIGEDVAEMLVSLRALGVDYYSARHESGAVGMADGYSRASGSVGVAVVSKGPGLLNAMNTLTTASKGKSAVIVFVADSSVDPSPKERVRRGKYIDQATVLEGAGVRHITLRSAETAVADVVAAFEYAASGATIVVNMPDSVFSAEAGDSPTTLELSNDLALVAPDPAMISSVADLLETTWAASRPVILAGRGAVRAKAKPALERLGELCGALLTNTLLANSIFRGDPFNLGIMGTFSNPVASELLGRADVLLCFGASMNGRTTYGGEIAPKALVVQFDADPMAFGLYPYATPELEVLGDVGLAAEALVAELEKRGHQSTGFRSPEIAERLAAYDPASEFSDQSDELGLDPRSILLAIERILPEDRVIVTDGGHHFNFEGAALTAYDPSSWISPLDFSSIGSGTGIALGAAIARPDRLTVLCVGDGGLMMTIAEIATAVRYKLPVLILVNNDRAYGSDLHILEVDGFASDVARSDDLSFERIALGMGADAVTLRSPDDVDALTSRLEGLTGPLLVEYRTTTNIRSDSLVAFMKLNKASSPEPIAHPAS